MSDDPTATSFSLPPDPSLPAAETLLDAVAVRRLLLAIGDQADEIGELDVRYLAYRPGRSLVVQYRARTVARQNDLVVWAPFGPIAAAGVGPGHFGNHAMHDPRQHDDRLPRLLDGLDAGASWYPTDIGLPALAATPATIAEQLGIEAPDAVRRLAWIPHCRATLEFGSAVIKMYADPDEARRAVTALQVVSPVVTTAELVGEHVDLGLVAQRRLFGESRARLAAIESAPLAAWAVAQLHRGDVAGVPEFGPADLIADIAGPVELLSFAEPALGGRLAELVGRLRNSAPLDTDTVLSHGDFNLGQLLFDAAAEGASARTEPVAVLDVDTLCRAPAAFDLASYAANLVSGRPGDMDDARDALAALIAGYRDAGGREAVDHLDWYLAAMIVRRIDRPLRRLKGKWRRRCTEMVTCAEGLLA